MTSVIIPILPPHLANSGSDFSRRLVGSGPFEFVRQTPNEIILEKNSHFFQGAPRLDRVIFKVIKEDNTRFLKMRKGEPDLVINSIKLNKVDDFKKNRWLNITR